MATQAMPSTKFLMYPTNVVAKDAPYALFLVVELLLADNRMFQDITELPMAKRGTFVISLAARNLSPDTTRWWVIKGSMTPKDSWG